jgi:low temperature requirement protein LtrA
MEEEHKVRPLELFFDLVFVLAFTQVTTKLAHDLSWQGLLRSLLVLAVLWWAWSGFAWLTNAFDAESKLLRIPVFIAIAALLVVALATPEAFGEYSWIFAISYLIVRVIHLILYVIGAQGNDEFLATVMRLAPVFVIAPGLIVVSCAFDGWVQAAFWVVAIALDYGGAYFLVNDTDWGVSADHFSERFGLIVLIALGESIVSIGVGAEGVELDAITIASAILAVTFASALWWMYFDIVAIVAARVLASLHGAERTKLARDTYAYLHYFLIAGIILTALAIKKTIGHPEEHLKEIPAVALGLGGAFYAGGLSAIKRRDIGKFNGARLIVAAAFLALIPIAQEVSAFAALAIGTGILLGDIFYEVFRYRDVRARIRAEAG